VSKVTYRKDDVDFHAEYMRNRHAAVNVKSYGGYGDLRGAVERVLENEGYILATGTDIDELTEAIAQDFGVDGFAAEQGWEQAAEAAAENFGHGYGVYSEGRSGGWCVVRDPSGRVAFDEDEVAGWDAIALARWARFARQVREIADDQAYRIAWTYIVNTLEPARADVASFALAGVGL
jgi:hypothetical protein